jgi:hypothetical protein
MISFRIFIENLSKKSLKKLAQDQHPNLRKCLCAATSKSPVLVIHESSSWHSSSRRSSVPLSATGFGEISPFGENFVPTSSTYINKNSISITLLNSLELKKLIYWSKFFSTSRTLYLVYFGCFSKTFLVIQRQVFNLAPRGELLQNEHSNN